MSESTATRVRVMTDVRIEAKPPEWFIRYWISPEKRAKELSVWVKEFHEFIRDHRSQDPVRLNVVPVYETQCSACHQELVEKVNEHGQPMCANCGAILVAPEKAVLAAEEKRA